jgi:hypothetical protein
MQQMLFMRSLLRRFPRLARLRRALEKRRAAYFQGLEKIARCFSKVGKENHGGRVRRPAGFGWPDLAATRYTAAHEMVLSP